MIHYKQQHSKSCGIAAMRMVLSHFGINISEKEYTQKVKMHSFGTFSTDLAIPYLKQGMKTKAYTFNLPMFAHLNLAPGELITISHLKHGLSVPSTKMIAESISNYITAGGELFWHFPTIEIISDSLNVGPCLISINTAALGQYFYHWNNGHYLVVSAYTDGKFCVDDPAYDLPQGQYWVEEKRLIAAITANALHSTDFCMRVFS